MQSTNKKCMTKASLSNQVTQETPKQIPPKTSKVMDHIEGKEQGLSSMDRKEGRDICELHIGSHGPAIKKLILRRCMHAPS